MLSIGELSEIESSSRLRDQNGATYLSAPLTVPQTFSKASLPSSMRCLTGCSAPRPPNPARENADLRIILRRVGHSGDLASKIRYSLLGIGP